MKIVGLITEYNPFHNGHKYHIQEALKITNSDAAIVIMSGDFVQRGTPAIMPKHLRARMALECGASLVLELPVYYASGSAEYFAHGAVSILDALGCVDAICFGSESGNLEELQTLAHILATESVGFQKILQSYLRQGIAFPQAREQAISDYTNNPNLAALLRKPNNTLAIEYLKALLRLKSPMKAYTIARKGSDYHENELSDIFSSASAIRKTLLRDLSLEEIAPQIPPEAFSIMSSSYGIRYPITENDFSILLKYKLLAETKDSLCEYLDMTTDLANRIVNQRNAFLSWTQFCEFLKTKELTYARISRVLLHILLNIRKDSKQQLYAKVLGFRKEHTDIMKAIKESASIPLITKLPNSDADAHKLDFYASDLYESVITDKFQTPFKNEYQKQIVIL